MTKKLKDIDFIFLQKDNYGKNKGYIKEISSITFESKKKLITLLDNNSVCLIAIVNNSIAGYLWIHFHNYKIKVIKDKIRMSSRGAYIGPGFVLQKYRGKKIFQTLLSRSLKYVYDLGYRQIYTSVAHKNKPSIRALINEGYKPIEVNYRIRIGSLVFYPKSKKGDLEYYSDIYYRPWDLSI